MSINIPVPNPAISSPFNLLNYTTDDSALTFTNGDLRYVKLTGSVSTGLQTFSSGASTTKILADTNTAAAPTYSFTGDTNTGIYRVGADNIGLSTGGTLRVNVSTTNMTSTLSIYAPSLVSAVNVLYYGAVGNGVADDTSAIQTAINTGYDVYIPPGTYKITSTLTGNKSIFGSSQSSSILSVVGAITGLDYSSSSDKSGIQIRDLKIIGSTGTYVSNSIGVNLRYLTNSTVVENLWIDDFDIGIKLKQAYYFAMRNIRIRESGSAGLYIDNAVEAVNGGLFENIFIGTAATNALYFVGGASCYGNKFIGCTFENSGETACVLQYVNSLSFDTCYWESNYRKARTPYGAVVLTWSLPISVKITNTPLRSPVVFENCYLAESTSTVFDQASSQRLLILCDSTSASVRITNSFHQGNGAAGNQIDKWLYVNTSSVITPHLSQVNYTGTPSSVYGFNSTLAINQPYDMVILKTLYNRNLRYTSQIVDEIIPPTYAGRVYIKIYPLTTDATAFTGANLRLYDVSGATIQDISLASATGYTTGTEIVLRGFNIVSSYGNIYRCGLTTALNPNTIDIFCNIIIYVPQAGDLYLTD